MKTIDEILDGIPSITGFPWANQTGKGTSWSDNEGYDITEEIESVKHELTQLFDTIIGKDTGEDGIPNYDNQTMYVMAKQRQRAEAAGFNIKEKK